MDGDNGYRLDTTEEIVSPQAWAEELAEIAPLLDDVADRAAFDRLRAISDSIAQSSEIGDVISGLDLAAHVLEANDDNQRRQAMNRLLFWAEERRPLDTHTEWDTFTPDDLEWIIEGWLPAGRIGILSGQGGRGKSRLALQLAAAMASGQADFLGGPPTAYGINRGAVLSGAQTVVYASWEDDRHEVGRRLRALSTPHNNCEGLHLDGFPFTLSLRDLGDRLRYVDMAGEGPVWGPAPGAHVSTMAEITPAGRRLRKYAEDSGAKMLVLDPLAAAFGSNENDRGLVRAFLANWDRWGRDNDCAILVISHPPKATGAAYSGSTDWEAGPRFMWTLDYKEPARGEDSKPALTLEKSNYGRRGATVWLEICNKGVWAEAAPDSDSDSFNPIPGV